MISMVKLSPVGKDESGLIVIEGINWLWSSLKKPIYLNVYCCNTATKSVYTYVKFALKQEKEYGEKI